MSSVTNHLKPYPRSAAVSRAIWHGFPPALNPAAEDTTFTPHTDTDSNDSWDLAYKIRAVTSAKKHTCICIASMMASKFFYVNPSMKFRWLLWCLGWSETSYRIVIFFANSLLIPQPSSLKPSRTSFMFEVKASKRLFNAFRMPLGKRTSVVCVVWWIGRCELPYRIHRIFNRKTRFHWLQVHIQTRERKMRWVDKTLYRRCKTCIRSRNSILYVQ